MAASFRDNSSAARREMLRCLRSSCISFHSLLNSTSACVGDSDGAEGSDAKGAHAMKAESWNKQRNSENDSWSDNQITINRHPSLRWTAESSKYVAAIESSFWDKLLFASMEG